MPWPLLPSPFDVALQLPSDAEPIELTPDQIARAQAGAEAHRAAAEQRVRADARAWIESKVAPFPALRDPRDRWPTDAEIAACGSPCSAWEVLARFFPSLAPERYRAVTRALSGEPRTARSVVLAITGQAPDLLAAAPAPAAEETP